MPHPNCARSTPLRTVLLALAVIVGLVTSASWLALRPSLCTAIGLQVFRLEDETIGMAWRFSMICIMLFFLAGFEVGLIVAVSSGYWLALGTVGEDTSKARVRALIAVAAFNVYSFFQPLRYFFGPLRPRSAAGVVAGCVVLAALVFGALDARRENRHGGGFSVLWIYGLGGCGTIASSMAMLKLLTMLRIGD